MKLIRFIIIFFIAQLNISVFSENIKISENQIYKNLRCLVCQGQSISESNSDFANTIKLVVKDKLSEGYNENEIYSFLVSKYGEWIVYKPPFSSSNLLLWTLPYIFLLLGAFFLVKIAINKKKFK
tara:strand:+ start:2413 stop:2787 length:375 start_codon:yes stop_codon:yes gene_type:complete